MSDEKSIVDRSRCPYCFCQKCGAEDPPPVDEECDAFKCQSCGHIYEPDVDKKGGII